MEWKRVGLMVGGLVVWLSGQGAAQTVSCATESGSSGSNYVCTISDCTSFDLNELAGLVGADGGSTIWIRAWGGAGGHGDGVAAADGGVEGRGGYAQTVTTIDDYFDKFSSTTVYFYLGAQGADDHPGGKGGASTIVAAADLATTTPCIASTGCASQNVVLIAGGGGGGGQASSDGLYAGGAGGDGGSAFAAQNSDGSAAGDPSSGNYQGEDSAGGGDQGTAGSAPSSSGGGKAQNGIGGYGGEVHVSSGGSTPTGWVNQMPTAVGTMGQGGEGGHGSADGGGGGGGWGGGGGGGSGGSLQGTGGGGGGSYALASTQPTDDAPSSKPDSPSDSGVFQIVFQNVARTPAAPAPTATATSAPSATRTVAGENAGVGGTVTPTAAATATPQDFGDNPDILNGQRVLADVVDLIVVNPITGGGSTAVANIILDTANGAIVGPQIDAAVVTAPCAQSSAPRGNPFPQQTRGARLFDTIEDVVVTLAPTTTAAASGCGGSDNLAFYVDDQLVPANGSTTTLSGAVSATNLMLAVADYNLDGFDDLLVLNDTQAFAATASDTGEPTAGLTVGPATALATGMTPLAEPATGDFNGDGLIDVAWIGGTYSGALVSASVYFATVCPGPVPDSICADQDAFAVLLEPLDAQPIALANPDTSCGGLQANAIASGNFSGDVSVGIPNQLLTVTINDDCQAAATLYGFDGALNATALTATTTLPGAPGLSVSVTQTFATSAVLDVLSAATQGIVAYGGVATDAAGAVVTAQTVAVVSYDGESTLSASAASSSYANLPPLAGLAVGLFGAPPEDDPTVADFTPQIGVLIGNDCTGGAALVNVYDIDTTTLSPSLSSQFTLSGVVTPSWLGAVNLAGSLLQAGDLQGESIRVGQPVILEVTTSMQPFVVLGAPPMHVDYVALDDDDDADVVNFSVLPTYYYSQFDTDVVGSNQSSTTSTTSYGHAIDLGLSENFGVAFAPGFELNGSFSQSLQLTYERTTAKEYDTFASLDFDASTQTAFYDEVWYVAQSYTMYSYPVIGQTSCPADATSSTGCDPTYPLYITLSGPTVDTLVNTQGAGLEWYQPVHEVGQVFSYPPNVTLLQETLTNPSEPLSSAVAFDTDTSSAQESVSWSISQGNTVTTGVTSTFSYELDNSVTGGTPLYNLLESGYQLTLSGDYENTSAQSTLNSTTTEIGESGGVTVVKAGLFLTPSLYAYQVEPFILGQTQPVSPDQAIALDTDVQTTGTLQTAFAADPTAGTGSWWTGANPYASYPDVALNHPSRWDYTAETLTDPPSACLQQTTDAAGGFLCMTMNDPDPDDLWNSQFYWMRGLFITVGGTDGTQRNTAVVGDDVYLQARIYNYSLTEMPAGTDVYVQFYMQQWDADTKTPIGDAILVNDAPVVIDAIPAFNETTPNWTTATTSFDTSAMTGDTTWVFWVLTWMQNDGVLVAEVPGHGLTAIPGTLTSIADVPLETVSVTLPDGSTDSATSFTNNVGFYNLEFSLQSADTAAALQAMRQGAAGAVAGAAADAMSVELSAHRIALGERVIVRSRIESPGGLPAGTFVYFYDEPYRDGARPFDVELLPPIRPGRGALAQVPYRPRQCGAHDIVVVAAQGRSEQVVAQATLDVACPTPTPGAGGYDDDACQVAPPHDRHAALLLLPVLALLLARRRSGSAADQRDELTAAARRPAR